MVGGLFLASHGFFGGGVGNLLAIWEQAGLFTYVLPFLLIFALVFGILTRARIFEEHRVINGILALSISLMSLQFGFVSIFFSEIFPRVGIALSIILVLLILVGLFFSPNSSVGGYFLLISGVVIFLIVIFNTFYSLGFGFGFYYFLGQHWGSILATVIILAVIGVIVGSGVERGKLPPYLLPYGPPPAVGPVARP